MQRHCGMSTRSGSARALPLLVQRSGLGGCCDSLQQFPIDISPPAASNNKKHAVTHSQTNDLEGGGRGEGMRHRSSRLEPGNRPKP